MPRSSEADGAEPRPPSRPRPGREQRRRQILQAGMRCFAEHGFRGTTTRELAEAVGITEAALYRYFDSKEALYTAIVDEKVRQPGWTEPLESAAARGDDRAVFEGLARAMLESVEADSSFLRILLYTGLEGHALAEPFFASRIRRLRDFLTGYLERRIAEGAFRAVDPVLGARALLGMVLDHMIVREIFRRDSTPPEKTAAEVAACFVSIFLDGIRTGEERKRVAV